jgi:hypothetical protein
MAVKTAMATAKETFDGVSGDNGSGNDGGGDDGSNSDSGGGSDYGDDYNSGGGNSEGHWHTQQSDHCGSGRNGSGGDSNGGCGCYNNQLQAGTVVAVMATETATATATVGGGGSSSGDFALEGKNGFDQMTSEKCLLSLLLFVYSSTSLTRVLKRPFFFLRRT